MLGIIFVMLVVRFSFFFLFFFSGFFWLGLCFRFIPFVGVDLGVAGYFFPTLYQITTIINGFFTFSGESYTFFLLYGVLFELAS